MVVEILGDIFITPPAFGLDHLIQICLYKARYPLLIPINKVRKCKAFTELRQSDCLALEQQFNAIIQGVKKVPKVKISGTDSRLFDVEEGIWYLSQPLSIVLENSLNDEYLWKAAIKFLTTDKLLQNAVNNGWLHFENGGGCGNVANVVEAKSKSFEALPKNNYRYLRCYVILDSDKDYPTSPQKSSYDVLLDKLDEMDVFVHILEKRSMENYLPDETFATISGISQAYREAYLALTPLQKDFFNIHKGFKRIASRTDLSAEVALFFDSVSDTHFDFLNMGAEMANFKSDFPTFMEDHHVHKTTLKNRVAHQRDPDELENVLNEIVELL